jgi:protoporphyrinogen/coproporphyrinogen III oxidase
MLVVPLTTVAVVGSGPAGLAAAFRLHEAGHKVRLFEAADYVGGRMKTLRRDGYLIEEGAIWMPDTYTSFLGICRDAGLAGQLEQCGARFAFPRDGRMHVIDCDRQLHSALRFGLVPLRSKLRLGWLMRDCHRHRRKIRAGDLTALAELDDESAADYARRVLDQESLDWIAGTALRGIAGDSPERLSKLDLLYTFTTFLGRVHGMAFRDGMSSAAEALASRCEVQLEAGVERVRQVGDEVEVVWRGAGGGERAESFGGCVLAIPPDRTVAAYPDLDPEHARFLSGIGSTPLVSLTAGVRKAPARYPYTYLTVPESLCPEIMLVVLSHNLAPARVPAGNGLVGVYPSPALSRELYDRDDEECVERITEVAERAFPGVLADPEFTLVSRWDPLVSVSAPGHYRRLGELAGASRSRGERIELAGDYFGVSSLNTASASGERAARALHAAMVS